MKKIFMFKKDFKSKGRTFTGGIPFVVPPDWEMTRLRWCIQPKHYWNLSLNSSGAIRLGIRNMVRGV